MLFKFKIYIDVEVKFDIPIMISTPSRRANRDRVLASCYDENIILDNVRFLKEIKSKYPSQKIFIGGLMGCVGDAYKGETIFDERSSEEFHLWQTNLF
ncbi:hypothetical protein [Clostridium intestinale]|uniref:Uncharacterized protein n=1 Tax=Clostridium intestinale DSM 6191 TaxID=1121320 RepID=A0A1M5W343_9CLOT|nr:hypothetical protein [Clostridium intestinale]SHH81881.1 hypothetical protein SAMN02745941_00903 [Clostridium intestinale DSM 6191]